MADNENISEWEKLVQQVSSPWDWVGIGVGATAGGAFSILTHGADFGQSIGAGALGGFTLRKAVAASMQSSSTKRHLNSTAHKLRHLLTQFQHTERAVLLAELDTHIDVWRTGATTDAEFEGELKSVAEKYKQLRNAQQPPTVPPNTIAVDTDPQP